MYLNPNTFVSRDGNLDYFSFALRRILYKKYSQESYKISVFIYFYIKYNNIIYVV